MPKMAQQGVGPSRGTQYLMRHFGYQQLIEADWSRGIVSDLPWSSIPPGGMLDCDDFLVDQPGLLRKRGGTSYQSSALGGTTAGSVNFVAAPEFPVTAAGSSPRVCGVGADGHLYDITTGTAVDAGVFNLPTLDTPKLYVDKLIVTPADGSNSVRKITLTAGVMGHAVLGGSPPTGRLSAIHISRIILAGSAANPNRCWFSPVPNVESTWDTSNSYVDFNHSLSAIASVQGVLLGFSSGATERLVGDIPPGTTGENMRLQPVGQIGCADARSVAAWGQMLIFASQEGVFVTNGAGFDSLMEKADGTGFLSYWRTLYAQVASQSNGFVAGGVLGRNYYMVTLGYGTGGSAVLIKTLLCYLPRKAWTTVRTAAAGCLMYAAASQGGSELYGARHVVGNRVVKLSGILSPTDANRNDADGTAVQPRVDFRMLGEGVGLKAFGDMHLTYDMRAGSGTPTMGVTVSKGLDHSVGMSCPEQPLAATTTPLRKHLSTGFDSQAAFVGLQQYGASASTNVYLFEAEQRPYDVASETVA